MVVHGDCCLLQRLLACSACLAYRFHVSSSTASRIFHKWLDLMYVCQTEVLSRLAIQGDHGRKHAYVFQVAVPLVLMYNRPLGDLYKNTNWF